MSALAEAVLALLSCALAGAAGGCAACAGAARQASAAQRREARRRAGAQEGPSGEGGLAGAIARYAVGLSRRLAFGATRPLLGRGGGRRGRGPGAGGPFAGSARAGDRRAAGAAGSGSAGGTGDANAEGAGAGRTGAWLAEHARKAGLADLSVAGFCEARLRLALAGAAAGGLVGAVLSNELAVLLGAAGLVAGAAALRWAVRAAEARRTEEVERCLSEMLEVVALGLRSGLSFDRSFELYGAHFASSLARACVSAQRRWSMGLATRDEALRDLAASYGSDQLARVVEGMVRSLRFGSSLAEGLEAAAVEARAEHKARREEQVAKAPVKMMLPTGARILPAMLLLVLGPVLLELADGF